MSWSTEELVAAAAAERAAIETLLEELVATPTVLGAEEAGQALMAAAMRDAGLEPVDVPLDADALRAHPLASPFDWDVAGKRNVVASLGGDGGGRSLLLNAHVDVVPGDAVDLWRSAPYEPRRDGDGWLYGRGACDDKSGLAAMIGAARILRRVGAVPAGRLVLQSVVEEEVGGNGALQCALAGWSAADACVVVEPTEGSITTAQVGVLWFELRVFGVASHAAEPGKGRSALAVADAAIGALRELAEELGRDATPPFNAYPHPVYLNVGRLEAGTLPSMVPADCRLSCRLSLLPTHTLDEVRERVLAAVGEAAPRSTVEFMGFAGRPYVVSNDEPIVGAVAAAAREVGLPEPTRTTLLGGTDARASGLAAGTPSICFGASGERMHGVDERVWLPSVTATAAALAVLVCDWCGLEP